MLWIFLHHWFYLEGTVVQCFFLTEWIIKSAQLMAHAGTFGWIVQTCSCHRDFNFTTHQSSLVVDSNDFLPFAFILKCETIIKDLFLSAAHDIWHLSPPNCEVKEYRALPKGLKYFCGVLNHPDNVLSSLFMHVLSFLLLVCKTSDIRNNAACLKYEKMIHSNNIFCFGLILGA